MRVRDCTCPRAALRRAKQNALAWMSALLLIAVVMFAGCNRAAESPIVPLGAEPQSMIIAGTPTRELKSITLPTPYTQTAPEGYYQDDDGLRLAISEIKTQAIQEPGPDEGAWRYVILTLTLTNLGEQPKDVTGFPFTVWLHEETTNEDYAPELYAPSDTSLWFAIDKLNKGTVKSLEKNMTVRGEIYFKTPAGATLFDLIWQPGVQRRWILQVPNLR